MAYTSKIKSEAVDELFKIILSAENLEECYMFFEDLCTVKELQSMAQRLQVAKLLLEKNTYGHIEEETGASTATISRVNRSLFYGAGGYLHFLKGALDKENEEKAGKTEK